MSSTNFFTLDQAQEVAAQTHERCLNAAKHTRRTLTFSHTTLLALRGMTLDLGSSLNSALLHTSVASLDEKSRLQGIQVHVWKHATDIYAIDDHISGVSVEQAICQMAPYTSQDALTMAMDWLTCHNPNLRQTTHEKLEEYVAKLRYAHGRKILEAALARSVEGTDSPQETLLRLRLIDAGLPCPSVNFPIIDENEQQTLLVDMAYPERKIAIEYDGTYHYDRNRWHYDLHKRNRLQHLGWKVFVATKSDFSNDIVSQRFISMIRKALNPSIQNIHAYGSNS